MKFTFTPGAVATNGPFTITVGAAASTTMKVSTEQLAAVWNRPLESIQKRILGMGKNPSLEQLDNFSMWLMRAGMTPAASSCINATK